MSMVHVHDDALASKVESYHEFLTRYSKTAKVVYGFVEGKDDLSYYQGFVDQILPDDWEVELWPAGNKNRVYGIYKDLDWRRFPKKRVCFFVDRDLSDLIPEKLVTDINIYVTDDYSIVSSSGERVAVFSQKSVDFQMWITTSWMKSEICSRSSWKTFLKQ